MSDTSPIDIAPTVIRAQKGKQMKKRRRRSAGAEEAPSAHEVLLGILAGQTAGLGAELLERHHRQGTSLLHLMTHLRPMLDGLDAVRQYFHEIANTDEGHSEIRHLMILARDDIDRGVETCLSQSWPRVLDSSRRLMEIEFLLLEFGADRASLQRWIDIEDHRRNQVFGFGPLRARQEQRTGVAPDHVLRDRNEYRTHSQDIHPSPKAAVPREPLDEITSIFFDIGDLFTHAMRVFAASVAAIEANPIDEVTDKEEEEYLSSAIDWDALDAAEEFIAKTQAAMNLPDFGPRAPIPKRASTIEILDQLRSGTKSTTPVKDADDPPNQHRARALLRPISPTKNRSDKAMRIDSP